MRLWDLTGMDGGGRDSDGDLEEAAELSPVLGITGNRLLSFRLTG
jgi:hypothetical protein